MRSPGEAFWRVSPCRLASVLMATRKTKTPAPTSNARSRAGAHAHASTARVKADRGDAARVKPRRSAEPMTISETAKPKARTRVKTHADPASHAAPLPADAAQASRVVERIRARWPSLTPAERDAFDGLSSDGRRAALGARCKPRDVALDAARWAWSIDRQLHELALLREHYHPKRFAYFLERLAALLRVVETPKPLPSRAWTKTSVEDWARGAHRRLLLAMERFAGARPAEVEQLSQACGSSIARIDGEGLIDSLGRLSVLAKSWMQVGEPVLLEAALLVPRLVADASASAGALAATIDGADVGPKSGAWADAPGLREGWVLEEMLRARDDIAAAHEEFAGIELLVPSPALRRVLSGPTRPDAGLLAGLGEMSEANGVADPSSLLEH